MGEQYTYTNPTVVLRERSDAGIIEFGFDIKGAFIPFGAAKLEGFREDLREAAEQPREQQVVQPQEQPQGEQPQGEQPPSPAPPQ